MDAGIDCRTNSYQQLRILDGLFIVIYQSIPLLWLLLLHLKRKELNPPLQDPRLINFVRDLNPSLNSLRFLFSSYTPKCYYFETIEM